ncbi:hypothetical protein SAMN04487995_0897 [Dyadobacter koreensis]|uniref:Uncharacterized protein n=1 Tax=Dyadobacter koreensis TaxID=408657 RepID=A0A1H6R070_9BACT|nr:hypothetical protein SAMN04487995_0897 [Dyadobacter koreensis]
MVIKKSYTKVMTDFQGAGALLSLVYPNNSQRSPHALESG